MTALTDGFLLSGPFLSGPRLRYARELKYEGESGLPHTMSVNISPSCSLFVALGQLAALVEHQLAARVELAVVGESHAELVLAHEGGGEPVRGKLAP